MSHENSINYTSKNLYITHLGIEGGESLLVVHNQVEVQRALVVPPDQPVQQEGDSHISPSSRQEVLATQTSLSGERNEGKLLYILR